jgi:hypothetical protein
MQIFSASLVLLKAEKNIPIRLLKVQLFKLFQREVCCDTKYCEDLNFRPLSQILVFESRLFFSNGSIYISTTRASQQLLYIGSIFP